MSRAPIWILYAGPVNFSSGSLRQHLGTVWAASISVRSFHAGCDLDCRGVGFFRPIRRLCGRLRPALEEDAMLLDYVLGGAVTALLLAYLIFALLWPEKF